MDRIEKLIKDELDQNDGSPGLDIGAVLGGVHSKIHRRSIRRKTLRSSSIVILLVMIVFVALPRNGAEEAFSGGELLMAGWEDSWTEIQDLDSNDLNDQVLYEQSVDYLIDEQYFSYIDDVDELLDDGDLEDFIGYLEEV